MLADLRSHNKMEQLHLDMFQIMKSHNMTQNKLKLYKSSQRTLPLKVMPIENNLFSTAYHCQLFFKGSIQKRVADHKVNFPKVDLNLSLNTAFEAITAFLLIILMSKNFKCIFSFAYKILILSVSPSPLQTETGQRLLLRSSMTSNSQWKRRMTHKDLTAKQQWTDRPSVRADAQLKVTLGEMGQLRLFGTGRYDQSKTGGKPSARSAWPALQQCRQNIFG